MSLHSSHFIHDDKRLCTSSKTHSFLIILFLISAWVMVSDTQADRKIRKRAKTRGPSRPCLDGSFWPRLPFQHAHQNARFKREFLQKSKYCIESHRSNFVWRLRKVNSHVSASQLGTTFGTLKWPIKSYIQSVTFSSIEKNPLQTIIIIRRFYISRLQVLLSDQRGPRQVSKHDHKTQLLK